MENAIAEYMAYPFQTDEAYQVSNGLDLDSQEYIGLVTKQGIPSVLADDVLINPTGNVPPNVTEEVLLRMKVFYFNRVTEHHITVEQVKNHVQATSTVPPSISECEDEPESRILTFAELQYLIESGKADQIPNNKIIPDKLNESSPSESKAVARKKPWELISAELP